MIEVKNYKPTISDIDPSWLKEISIEINKGNIKYEEARKNCVFLTEFGKITQERSLSTFKRMLKENNIHVFERGKKGKPSFKDEDIKMVYDIFQEFNLGSTKTWEILKSRGNNISKYQVQKIFSVVIKPKEQIPKKNEIPRCRYLIDKVNGVWHGDIHYLIFRGKKKYLFCLLDDRSRYIPGFDIFEEKSAKNVRNCFQKTIKENNCKPLVYWSDNGTENIALEMKMFLSSYQIAHVKTFPGNPQQNGKIERFWVGLDNSTKKAKSWDELNVLIENYIYSYNNIIPHHGLETKRDGTHKIPAKVFFDLGLRAKNYNDTQMYIDSKGSVSLSEYLEIENLEKNYKNSLLPSLSNILN